MTTCDVHDMVREDGYNGFFKIGKYTFSHDKFDGTRTEPMTREMFERGNAVAVLPYDPKTDEVLLIQQFLLGAHLAGIDNRPYQVVAGMIEEGEAAHDVAFRETAEESGVDVIQVIPAQNFIPSPGGSPERLQTFLGLADLTNAGGIHGLDEEQEDIRAVKMPAQDAINLLDNGIIEMGPAVVLLSWFARRHKWLRSHYG